MKSVRFVNTTDWPAVYQVGDIAAFEPAVADKLIQQGVAIDHAWDTAGPGGAALTGAFMAGKTGVPFTYVPTLPGSGYPSFSAAAPRC